MKRFDRIPLTDVNNANLKSSSTTAPPELIFFLIISLYIKKDIYNLIINLFTIK